MARPTSRLRIRAIRVTFADAAIRGVNIAGRMTKAPFAPLRGPWSPFAGAGLVGPVGTVFLFRRAVFRAWIDILQGKVERITIILTCDSDQWEQAGHSEGGAHRCAFGIPVPVTEHRILPESSSPLENGKTWLVSARYEPRALSRRRMAS
jgi:hypothetical protein